MNILGIAIRCMWDLYHLLQWEIRCRVARSVILSFLLTCVTLNLSCKECVLEKLLICFLCGLGAHTGNYICYATTVMVFGLYACLCLLNAVFLSVFGDGGLSTSVYISLCVLITLMIITAEGCVIWPRVLLARPACTGFPSKNNNNKNNRQKAKAANQNFLVLFSMSVQKRNIYITQQIPSSLHSHSEVNSLFAVLEQFHRKTTTNKQGSKAKQIKWKKGKRSNMGNCSEAN